MTNLVLFSHHYQPTIHKTFSSTSVIHYHSDDFYSNVAHANVADDEFTFLGGLHMLIQSMEDIKYQHMYVVDHWKKSEFAVAKLSGMFPVMIELTDSNVAKVDELAVHYMLNADRDAFNQIIKTSV